MVTPSFPVFSIFGAFLCILPHSIKTDQHIATVPETGSHVRLLTKSQAWLLIVPDEQMKAPLLLYQ